ncbi:MAG: hypothetical protein ACK4XJ_00985 [Fimbriimonadaceae bacterium]
MKRLITIGAAVMFALVALGCSSGEDASTHSAGNATPDSEGGLKAAGGMQSAPAPEPPPGG